MNKLKPLQLQASISNLKSMSSGYWRIQIDTIEKVSPDKIAYMAEHQNKVGWFTYNVSQIENEDIIDLPPVMKKEKRSLSQQQRDVIFRLWEQQYIDKYENFKDFYGFYMEQIIDKIKSKLQ